MATTGEAPAVQNGELEWLSDYVINFLKSPTWVTPIAQFVDERCIVFDAEEENKLEYTPCHQEFKHLIDGLFAAHLLEVNVTHEQFEGFCQNGLTKSPRLHKVLIEQLLSVDDFLTFKAMMVKRNADLYREVLKRMVEGNEGSTDFDTSLDLGETIFEVGEEDKATKDLVSSEWQVYEDQLFKNLQSPEEAERLEAQRRCEEAELEQAIALSLQAEEERLRQLDAEEQALKEATTASMDAAACQAAPAAPAEALTAQAPPAPAVEAAAAPAPAPVAPAPAAAEPTPPASAGAGAPLAAPATLAPLKSALPRLMRVEPLSARPPLPPVPAQAAAAAAAAAAGAAAAGAAPSRAAEERRGEVAHQRQRAQRAMAMPAATGPAAPAPAPARPEPTDEERKARAEHLRRQRELLVAKRNQERERKLQEFQQSRRAADSALSSTTQAAPVGDAGKRLVAELMPSGAPAAAAQDANSAAVQMRQALNAQLRQTLSRSVSSSAGALDDQINRLEQMKLR